ncbi:MAG: SDR family oxidoreductase [Prevotella sp.]|nr:SDR family oxidoreductase [Prevotella sp.]
MNHLFDIKDRVIVITGGTGVLGSAIACYLASQGARVALLGRNVERGNAITDNIESNGGQAVFLQSDVLNRNILEQNCMEVMKRFGRVDALLNAAGGNMPGATIAPDKTIFDLNAAAFQQVMNLNLTGTLLPTQVFLKPMAERKRGAVVNFSSMSAFRPLTRVAGYGVAKAGVSNFTAYMATEVANKFSPDIRVNAIAPGFFLTEQNRTLLTNEDGTWTERGHDIIRQTPMNRMGNPDDLYGTIHYLISDASRFVTGTVAVVDGGFNVFSI